MHEDEVLSDEDTSRYLMADEVVLFGKDARRYLLGFSEAIDKLKQEADITPHLVMRPPDHAPRRTVIDWPAGYALPSQSVPVDDDREFITVAGNAANYSQNTAGPLAPFVDNPRVAIERDVLNCRTIISVDGCPMCVITDIDMLESPPELERTLALIKKELEHTYEH